MESFIAYYRQHRYHQPWMIDIGAPIMAVITKPPGINYQADLTNGHSIIGSLLMRDDGITVINDDAAITIQRTADGSSTRVQSSTGVVLSEGSHYHGAILSQGWLRWEPFAVDVTYLEVIVVGATDRITFTSNLVIDQPLEGSTTTTLIVDNSNHWSVRVVNNHTGEALELIDDRIYYPQ